MAESTYRPINKLSDLPNFKMNFPQALNDIGITTIDDLKEVLMDNLRTASVMNAISGLGPKTIEMWRAVIFRTVTMGGESPAPDVREDAEKSPLWEGTSSTSDVKESEDIGERRSADQACRTEPSEEEIASLPSMESDDVVHPRNLFCSIDDLHEIKQTLIELLEWDGAKRKGMASTVKYAVRKLKHAGLAVSMVNDEDGDPLAIIASKGKGGLTLWGHLDTEFKDNIDGIPQGMVALDFVYGRGVVDMKGGLAVLLCAAPRMSEWGTPFSIVLTTDALNDQKGAQWVAQNPLIRESKGILILAPTGMCPVHGQVGRLDMSVTVFGEDSILAASAFLSELAQSEDMLKAQKWLRVGLIRGGKRKEPFGPANSCQMSFKILTGFPTNEAVDIVDDILRDRDHLTEIMRRSEPLELSRESSLVREVEGALGKESRLYDVKTEVGHLFNSNPNICIFGPGDPSASRSSNESVVVTDLEKTYELVLRAVNSYAK